MKKQNGFISLILAFLIIALTFMNVGLPISYAEGRKLEDVVVTDFKLLNENGSEVTGSLYSWSKMKLDIEWDASSYGNQLKRDDYFEIEIPQEFKINEQGGNLKFNIYGPDGTSIMGKALVTRNGNLGGKIKVTFTDYVENKEHNRGRLLLTTAFSHKAEIGKVNNFTISIGATFKTISVKIEKNPISKSMISKWTDSKLNDDGTIQWSLRLNSGQEANHINAVVKDRLEDRSGNGHVLKYIKDSFNIAEYVWVEKETGWETKRISSNPIPESDIVFSNNDTEFSYTIGDLSEHFYLITYKSTYVEGSQPYNNATLSTSSLPNKTTSARYVVESGIGGGLNDAKSKIEITKVDAEDNTPLAGAVFKVKNVVTSAEVTLTTGSNGKITSGVLTPGNYEVKEFTAPKGYVLDDTPKTVTVEDSKLSKVTFTNIPEKRNIKVTKTWVGGEASSVEVILKADGAEKERHTINSAPWEYTFTNLRKTKHNGTLIDYIVDETPIANYNKAISGDMDNGFTITNTKQSTPITNIEIPVEKVWSGGIGGEVTVHLISGGSTVQTIKLNSGNNWKNKFTNIPKMTVSGDVIAYDVIEDAVNGYTSSIVKTNPADISQGVTVTNTKTHIIPKKDIKVEKKWIGAEKNSVTVRLYANNVEVSSKILNRSNNWKAEFKNFPLLDSSSNPIRYRISEDLVEGYDTHISGNTDRGFIITNTEVVDIPVKKEWVGKRGEQAVVKLLADNVVVRVMTLNTINNWEGVFYNQPKYNASGEEINYKLEEEPVSGYTSQITQTSNITDGFTVKNILNPTQDTLTIPVKKTWVGDKADEVEITLKADGVDTEKSLKLSEANNWAGEFTGLFKFNSNGEEIKYEVSETTVEGYKTEIKVVDASDITKGFEVINTKEKIIEEPKVIDLDVTKKWLGTYPSDLSKIKVVLVKNGELTTDYIELDESNSWTDKFIGLPEKDKVTGEIIVYTIKEDGEENGKVVLNGVEFSVRYEGTTVVNEKITSDPQPQPKPEDPKPEDPKPEDPAPIDPEDPTPLEPQEPWRPDPRDIPKEQPKEDGGIGGTEEPPADPTKTDIKDTDPTIDEDKEAVPDNIVAPTPDVAEDPDESVSGDVDKIVGTEEEVATPVEKEVDQEDIYDGDTSRGTGKLPKTGAGKVNAFAGVIMVLTGMVALYVTRKKKIHN